MRVAILVHGFLGNKGMMNEIEKNLSNDPYDKYYDKILNISYYGSPFGIDMTKTFDLRTPIFEKDSSQTLTSNFHKKLLSKLQELESSTKNIKLDIYAHSMGGLVTRAMICYHAKVRKRSVWLTSNIRIKRVFFLGTPNHGTRLAQKVFTMPIDILISGLNILFEIPGGGLTAEDFKVLNTQFQQMVPKSNFLCDLEKKTNKLKKRVKWVTVRGLNSSGILGIIWQPFIFKRFWIDNKFPFIHRGMIPNDGIVNANSVPLKNALNLEIPKATHMDLIKWNSNKAGIKVEELLRTIILEL